MIGSASPRSHPLPPSVLIPAIRSVVAEPSTRARFDAAQKQLTASGFEKTQKVQADIRDAWNQRSAASPAMSAQPGMSPATGLAAGAVTGPQLSIARRATPTAPVDAQVTLAQMAIGRLPPVSRPAISGPALFGAGVIAGGMIASRFTVDDPSAAVALQRQNEFLGVDPTYKPGKMASAVYGVAINQTQTELQAWDLRAATGLKFDPAKVSRTGPYRNALTETLAQIEYDAPGTFSDLTRQDIFGRSARKQAAMDRVQAQLDATFEAIDRGLLGTHEGALIGRGLATERFSAVDSALNATGAGRKALIDAGRGLPGKWQAHHKVPFAEVAQLDVDTQLALARSGWRMDALENMIAMPADEATYAGLPNRGILPMHTTRHDKYSSLVRTELDSLQLDRADGYAVIREHINAIGNSAIAAISGPLGVKNGFHPRLK